MARGTNALLAIATLLALARPAPAAAQVAPPRMVEEDEPQEPAKPPPAAPPAGPAAEPTAPAPPPPPPATGGRTAPAGPPAPSASPPPPATPAVSGATVGPPLLPAPEPARKITPVQTSWGKLVDAWAARRKALREGDPAGADAAQKTLLSAQRELGIENLVPMAAAEVRAVSRALASNLPAEALARAELAVTLAPDWPEAHLVRSRALLATQSGGIGAAAGAVADAVAAAFRNPRSVRAFLGDVFSALLAAVMAAAVLAVVLPALLRLPFFLHDFHHLPLLRGTAGIQSSFLALVLLATPVALGLGPVAALGAVLLCTWLYLSLRERIVATVALLALLAAPWAAEQAAARTVWTGTLADHIHQIEHGALSDEEAAAAVKALGPDAPAPLLVALGRHMKRRGDLESALRLYRAAAAADPHAAEILVDIGNVLFVKNDLEGARNAYLAAQDRAEGDLIARGTAAYNLSKLFIRTAEMEKSSAARQNAEQMAGAFLAGHGSDEDFSANHYLVDVPVPPAKLVALTRRDSAPAGVRAALQRLLLNGVPAPWWPWVAGFILALLWGLSLSGDRLHPSRSCHRCGRPVCRRCDGATGRSCGQCVNVFDRRGVVDARDHQRKEQQVRRRAMWARRASRAVAVVLAGGGHLVTGAPVRGALLLFGVAFCAFLIVFWPGATPPPYPSALALPGKILLAAPVGLAIWAVAVRDHFRRSGDS